jgi:hypothetical protein
MTSAGRASVVALLTLWAPRAWAYRPFDLTDAEVAPPREFELELGPCQGARSNRDTSFVPGFVVNYGIAHRLDLVAEDHSNISFGASNTAEPTATAPSFLVKGILREGALQEKTGPSVAVELGLLLPVLPHPDGFGASSALIVSERWPAAAVHLNAQVDLSRQHHLDALGGFIVEGPHTWRIRPVGEAYVEHEREGVTLLSGLAGAIWTVSDDLSSTPRRAPPARTWSTCSSCVSGSPGRSRCDLTNSWTLAGRPRRLPFRSLGRNFARGVDRAVSDDEDPQARAAGVCCVRGQRGV